MVCCHKIGQNYRRLIKIIVCQKLACSEFWPLANIGQIWHDVDVTLRRAKQVQGSLSKLADFACKAFGAPSRQELAAGWAKVMEQYGPMAAAMASPARPQMEKILGPELMPDAGAPYDGKLAVGIFRAIADDGAGIEFWRTLPDDESGIAFIKIFSGLKEFITINTRRDAAALVSAIPHHRGGGRPPEKWPDDATCREIRRKIRSLYDSGLGIPKMEAYKRVASEYGKSPRMVRRIFASQKDE